MSSAAIRTTGCALAVTIPSAPASIQNPHRVVSRQRRSRAMSEIDFTTVDALTFDCYGTLIDWESGILNAMQPVLAWHPIDTGEQELLEAYARHEAALEAGDYLSYRDILARALRRLCEELGIASTEAQEA